MASELGKYALALRDRFLAITGLKRPDQGGAGPRESAHSLIVLPVYDRLTRAISEPLIRFLGRIGPEAMLLHGPEAGRERLLGNLTSCRRARTRCLVLFFGHGEAAALLTSTDLGGPLPSEVSANHGLLVHADDLAMDDRIHLAAMCCYSGKLLAPRIRSAHPTNSAVAFSEELWFDLSTRATVEAFARPVAMLFRSALASGAAGKAERESLLASYDAEIEEWESGPSSREPNAILVSMFLRDHLEVLES